MESSLSPQPGSMAVDERMMSFIWQSRLFTGELCTVQGELVQIRQTGFLNRDQGPDFWMAKVEIAGLMLAGHVELHQRTSDWNRHGHSADPRYAGVVLHVVWKHDLPQPQPLHTPLLILSDYVLPEHMERIQQLMQARDDFACTAYLPQTDRAVIREQLEYALVERLERKHDRLLGLLQRHTFHWEHVTFMLIAEYLGAPVNQVPMLMIAERLPWQGVGLFRNNPMLAEAVLFGLSGLLDHSYQDDYPRALQQEWRYQRKRLNLEPLTGQPLYFLRMRPAHFPGIRLAQLAALWIQGERLFHQLPEIDDVRDVYPLLSFPVNSYWDTHYHFDMTAPPGNRQLGRNQADVVIINALVPILFTYGKCRDDDRFLQKALQWLEGIKPERNRVLRLWQEKGIKPLHASMSQGMLQQYLHYCQPVRCWECRIARSVVYGIK